MTFRKITNIICEDCKMENLNLCYKRNDTEYDLCFNCWREKNGQTQVGNNIIVKKRYIFLKNHPVFNSFTVYFNKDNTQNSIRGCDDDGEVLKYFGSDDTLMFEGNRVKLLSEIPNNFHHHYEEVEFNSPIFS